LEAIKRVSARLDARAPWLTGEPRAALLEEVTARPRKRRADKLAAKLALQDDERTRLNILMYELPQGTSHQLLTILLQLDRDNEDETAGEAPQPDK
jgi:hypothetical protein